MPRCQPVECVYQDFYGGDNTRITSYGRKRREVGASPARAVPEEAIERWSGGRVRSKRKAEVSLGEEVLVTHAFIISDTFNKHKKEAEAKEMAVKPKTQNRKEPNYSNSGSLAYGEHGSDTEEVAFDPDHLEVCLNATGLIAGIAVFLIVQLLLVFLWTHFWQTRNKKKMRSSTATLR